MIDEKKQEKINDQLFGHIEREAKERRKKQVEKQQRMQQNNGKDPEKISCGIRQHSIRYSILVNFNIIFKLLTTYYRISGCFFVKKCLNITNSVAYPL